MKIAGYNNSYKELIVKTRNRITPVIIVISIIVNIVVSSILIVNVNKEKASDDISDQMKEYYINETEPEGNIFYSNNANSISLPKSDKTGESKLIRLPLYRQSHNFTCGVSCVSSVLRYAGYDFDTREDRLFLELGSTPENGTNYMKIVEYLGSVRLDSSPDKPVFSTKVISLDYDNQDSGANDSLLREIRTTLDDNHPIICAIQAWKDDADYSSRTEEDDGHYVVLIGYSKGNDGYLYYFMDPSTSGSYTYLTEDEFILRWHDSLEGKSKRIGIEVSYLNPISEVPINVVYHID